jgi:tRNA threonylcarbamoyl adenosine modification protein YeaZ
MPEGLVLALDGSTHVCSAALLRAGGGQVHSAGGPECGWDVLTRRAETDGRGQAKVLIRLVDEMLEEIDCRPNSLGALVVGVGPGTFTGVRIAVATARALGLALTIPVLGVSTLGALAAAGAGVLEQMEGSATEGKAVDNRDLLMPVVDARRGQVFFALYERVVSASDTGPAWARLGEVGVCDRGSLSEVLGCRAALHTAVVAEDEALAEGAAPGAAVLTLDVTAEHLVAGQWRLMEPGALPQGGRLGPWLRLALAGQGMAPGLAETSVSGMWSPDRAGEVGTPESVKPIYVRSPDADIHITKMKDPWGDGLGRA